MVLVHKILLLKYEKDKTKEILLDIALCNGYTIKTIEKLEYKIQNIPTRYQIQP